MEERSNGGCVPREGRESKRRRDREDRGLEKAG